MGIVVWVVAAGILVWVVLFWMGVASKKKYFFEPGYRQIHLVATPDGGTISLYRYPSGRGKRPFPVILCHGLAANRFNFDLGQGVSLARTLQEHGYDVWALELRGRGKSRVPRAKGPSYYRSPCFFDDYVRQDAPAAISYVQRETGSSQVHWIGHSMGGMVLYGVLQGEWAREIASGVAVASPCQAVFPYPIPFFSGLAPVLARLPALHFSFFSRSLAALVARVRLPQMSSFLNPDNVEISIIQRALCFLASDVTRGEILQFLRWTALGELRSMDGSYSYSENLQVIQSPLFLIAGTRDLLAPPSSIEDVYQRISSKTKRIRILGKKNGQRKEYGHGDLLIGRDCPEEVFPAILEWLEAVDRTQDPGR